MHLRSLLNELGAANVAEMADPVAAVYGNSF